MRLPCLLPWLQRAKEWCQHPGSEENQLGERWMADAGITSRRICRYVVTRRLLRRDASDVTS